VARPRTSAGWLFWLFMLGATLEITDVLASNLRNMTKL